MADVDTGALRAELVAQVRSATGVVSDRVAAAIGAVPRHLFLPGVAVREAYQDDAIVTKRDERGQPISSSSQPTMMALMLDQLRLTPGQRVLEIGAGTGYNAALMAHLVGPDGSVTSVDIDADLVGQARANLAKAGFDQVRVERADGADGFAAAAPYDRIIATVGVWDLAPGWLQQLAPGGRIVVPLDLRGVQRSVAFENENGHWVSRSIVPCGFMRLRGTLAGPERTYVLDQDTGLSITLPDGAPIDPQPLLAAMDQTPVARPIDAVIEPEQLLTDLGLWLAITEPHWCMLAESTPKRLSTAPVAIQEMRITAGLRDDDGLAILAADQKFRALGYGVKGEILAARLAAQVTAWDRAGRPGAEMRIDAYAKPGPQIQSPGAVVLPKKDHVLVLSWPRSGSPFAVKPTLVGPKATLRPFRPDDLPPLSVALADPDVLRLTGGVHSAEAALGREPRIDDEMRSWYASRNDQPDRLDLAVVDNVSGRCVGEVVLNEWDAANESCNFRIMIGPDGRGRGLGTEATRHILHYAFTELGLHRVGLEVYAFNPRARHVYEKAGFKVEGVRRDALKFGGTWVDAIVMSALSPS